MSAENMQMFAFFLSEPSCVLVHGAHFQLAKLEHKNGLVGTNQPNPCGCQHNERGTSTGCLTAVAKQPPSACTAGREGRTAPRMLVDSRTSAGPGKPVQGVRVRE